MAGSRRDLAAPGAGRAVGGVRPGREYRVLVIDDSAVVRQVMTAILSREPDMRVAVAADPLIALRKIPVDRPDVILLDLEMPRMDGLRFLRKIMAEDPIPVVVCSGLTARGADAAMRALEEGAVEVVEKPKFGIRNFLEESAVLLVDALRAAASARRAPRSARPASAKSPSAPRPRARASAAPYGTHRRVVAIGASTGGTEAIGTILEALPADAPGIVVVQHMPERFTAAFARRLNADCTLDVKEAESGDRVYPGRVLIAPGNRHMMLRRQGHDLAVDVVPGPLVSRHRPSVDVLFRSVAHAAGPDAVGILLTGMGDDGAAGLLEMKRAGAATLVQDRASCVVFGMPSAAIDLGAADDVLPLSNMAGALLSRASAHPGVPLARAWKNGARRPPA